MTETVQPMESTADALSLYEVLGCSKQASSSELKTAYRKLALQLHPDKNMGDRKAAERFQAVSRAYDVLGDPQKRQFYDNNGITGELDVSAEDWMASFTEMVHEFTGGMPIKEMFNGLSASDLAAMPPFPFPRELFPPDTFPTGVQFTDESLNMLPPSVRELVESGQAASLGLMFEASSEHLEPEFGSLFSMLMGGVLPSADPASKNRSSRSRKQKENVQFPHGAMPQSVDMDAIRENFAMLSACSEEELVEKLMKGDLDLGDLGLGGTGNPLMSSDTEASSSEPGSESEQSEPEHRRSAACSDEASGELSELDDRGSPEGGGCGQGTGAGAGQSSTFGSQGTILIQHMREQDALALDGSIVGESSGGGEAGARSVGGSADDCNLGKGGTVHNVGQKILDTSSDQQQSQPCSAENGSGGKILSAKLCTQWFSAAKSGHVPSLQSALACDQALLERKGPGVGHTALHWAAAGGHVVAVRWLLAMGARPNTVNAVGSTALHAAAAHGHADVLSELLNQDGCNLGIVNEDGDTAQQVSHRREHRDCVLLLRQPQSAGQPQAVGVRSELKSCTVGQQEAAASSSSHAGNRNPHVEQVVAPDKGRTNSVCVLESCGADDCRAGGAPKNVPGAPTPGGLPHGFTGTTTSEGRSCKEDSFDASVCAFQGVDDSDWGRVVSKEQGKAWMHAAKAGNTPVLQKLLESNVALLAYRGQGTAFGFGGNSALHWAVAKGHSTTARILLGAGADPNCGNNAGRTPLHSAVCNKQLSMVQLLVLEGGADPGARDLDGDTPRDAALCVFGADHDALKSLDCCSLACKLRDCVTEGSRWQVREMKALLATAGVAVIPGSERGDLELQCREWLKGLPKKILAPDRTADIKKALTEGVQDGIQARAESAAAVDTCMSVPQAHAVSDACSKGEETAIVPVHASAAKEKGNAAFSGGDYRRAIVQYTMALRVTKDGDDTPASSHTVSLFRATVFSNRSAAHAASRMWQQALYDAQEALKIDDKCAKYWCRKGAAQLGYGRLQDAVGSYKQALEVDGSSEAARSGLEQARSMLSDTHR